MEKEKVSVVLKYLNTLNREGYSNTQIGKLCGYRIHVIQRILSNQHISKKQELHCLTNLWNTAEKTLEDIENLCRKYPEKVPGIVDLVYE